MGWQPAALRRTGHGRPTESAKAKESFAAQPKVWHKDTWQAAHELLLAIRCWYGQCCYGKNELVSVPLMLFQVNADYL